MAETTTSQGVIPPDLEQEVLDLWPSLPANERLIWFKVLNTLLPPNTDLINSIEDLEAAKLDESAPAESASVQRIKTAPPPARANADWRQTVGMFADDAIMDAIVEAGSRIREAERSQE